MKRADALKAIDVAFGETLTGEYKNALITGLAADRPDLAKTDAAFRKALAINLAAHAMGSRAILDNPDLEE